MEERMLATDIVLRAIIARNDDSFRKLIEQAQSGEILLIIPQTALYWAVHTVKENDTINSHRNGLTNQGTDVLRITGLGKIASNLK